MPLAGEVRMAFKQVHKARQARQSGVTLIEVMVSMLIMTLALVAMAALQSSTLKYQLGSSQRAVLSVLLADFAERVRANLTLVQTNPALYQVADALPADPPALAKDCVSVSCSAAELAAFDMSQWRTAVRRELPNGAVQVSGSPVTGMRVSFIWFDKDYNSVVNTVLGQRSSPVCSATDTGLSQQTCCPVTVPAGTRCATFTVTP
jgi:type IV pilus assembly protein PilV